MQINCIAKAQSFTETCDSWQELPGYFGVPSNGTNLMA